MGGSSYTDDEYRKRAANRAATGTPTFAYNSAINSGTAVAAVHKDLDPLGVKIRESRDSDAHPESLAIGVVFDVTGSMGGIPVVLQKKLSGLMALLLQKGYVAHPQILFGAIGDANSDRAPLQIGQFESGLEMEDDLSRFYLEAGGGGQVHETYELAHYFFARHTSTDCWEKRGQKGYLFTIGDEAPYDVIRKRQVKDLIGDDLEGDLTTKQIFEEVQERYHVFHIIAEQGAYPHRKDVEDPWVALLGERVLKLEDSDLVAELIAMTIGLTEGTVDMDTGKAHLADVGATDAAIGAVTSALVPLVAKQGLTKAGSASGALDGGAAGVDQL